MARRIDRTARTVSGWAAALALVAAGAGEVRAATINGSSTTGSAGDQVTVSFTLNGNGVTRSIGAVYTLNPDLSFVGAPTGGNPPFQCTSGGIAWTNTGSAIPTNAGTCTYTVQIAPNATPGVKQITLTQASCDDVCTLNPAQVTVALPATAPTISYAPVPGSTVTLAGGGGDVGTTATAAIGATPSGGTGTGAAATTTISGCVVSGPGAGVFGTPPTGASFVGAQTTGGSLPLSCTRAATAQNALLTCNETRGGDPPLTWSWPVVCPAGSASAVAPTLSYAPTPGSTVAFGGGSGALDSTASGSVVVTPSGGAGTGAAATTTVTGCAIGGAGAGAFTLGAANLSFVGAPTTSQAIAMTCRRGEGVSNATLSCTESAGGAAGVLRSWSLACPAAVAAVQSSVSLSVSPSRITQSGTVALEWAPQNATGCQVTSNQIGTVITPTAPNRANAAVSVGTQPRNEIFTVSCAAATGGTVSNATVLSVGVPPPPPAPPVINVTAVGTGGQPANGASRNAALSDGGRFVVFESTSSNLVAGDTNNALDVFRRDLVTGEVRRVSVPGGALANVPSGNARVSRDGNIVVFTQGTQVTGTSAGKTTFANGQICLNNLATSAAECISKGPNGTPGNGSSNNGALSGDGDVVVYESTSTNLSPQDTNGAISDVFAFKRSTNTVEMLSLDVNGVAGNAPSTGPAVSCNGRWYAFETRAALVNGPVQAGVRNIVLFGNGPKRLVTVGVGNTPANGDSGTPRVTDDGRYVFFESSASNLVEADTNGVSDVFVADVASGTIRRISTNAGGEQGNGPSSAPRIPCDGAYASFTSRASNLVAGDDNGTDDVFVVNMGTGAIALGSQLDGSSGNPDVSPDGSSIGFESSGQGGGQTGVFAGDNPFAGQNYTGAWFDPAQAGHGLFLDHLADGRLVAWWFTFEPNGQQAWFGGVGQAQGTNAVVSIVRTEGARFLPNFDTADARNTPIGTLTFNFSACDRGRVDFALAAPFGNGFMDIQRLTTPVGVGCDPGGSAAPKRIDLRDGATSFAAKAEEPTVGPIADITGAWYDPAQAGHGLFVENIGDRRLLLWWFTFGPNGGQSWFGNIADIVDGNTANITFLRTQGGRWIPNFNPANVTNPALGTATIRFEDCETGTITYAFGQGYGSGTMILRPLLRPIGAQCRE